MIRATILPSLTIAYLLILSARTPAQEVYPAPGERPADIVFSGDIRGGTGRFTITRDISFSVLTTLELAGIVFDDWVPASDGSDTRILLAPSTMAYRIDNGPLRSTSGVKVADNINSNRWGRLTANDGWLDFVDGDIPLTRGQRMTLYAGSWAITQSQQFTVPARNEFRMRTYATNSDGQVTFDTGTVSVKILPETWTWQPPASESLTRFKLIKQGTAPVLTWDPDLREPSLEISTDLQSWRPVTDPVFGNFYVIPTTKQSAYYRLRFQR